MKHSTDLLHVAAILTHAHVVTHPPMAPEEQLDVYEHFLEQARVIEAESRAAPGSNQSH